MLRLLSHVEQLAAYLRQEIQRGRWHDAMPGVAKLEAELGINHTTIAGALLELENEGLLVSTGNRRRRQIVLGKASLARGLRVGIMRYEPADIHAFDLVELRHQLLKAGHMVRIPAKSLTEVAMDAHRVARIISRNEVDAWVVISATENVLRWFESQPIPALAYAGHYWPGMNMAGAGPNMGPVIAEVLRKMVKLGHRRIIWLARESQPKTFFTELEALGIPTGPYNLPRWENSRQGLGHCLDSLFATTPPTALFIDEAPIFIATQNHLARRGILAPRHVSLVCTDPDPSFQFSQPTVAHASWQLEALVRGIVKWVSKVARGKVDHRMLLTKAEFNDGDTLGPVPEPKPGGLAVL